MMTVSKIGRPKGPRVKLTCAECGKEVEKRPLEAERIDVFYCSAECRHKSFYTEVTCAECGKVFMRNKSGVKEKNYCSQACFKRSKIVNTTCAGCGKPIKLGKYRAERTKRNFCSMDCMCKNKEIPHPVFKCDYCGKESTMPWSQYNRSKNHFCSQQCNNRFHNAEKNKTLMTPEVREKVRQGQIEYHLYGPKKDRPKPPPKPKKQKSCKSYRRKESTPIHRIVAEEILGRKLKPGEVVHHINLNKLDNTPENLFVFSSSSEHSKYHKALEKGIAPKLVGGKEQKILFDEEGGDVRCNMSQENTSA